jgi:hypothetical protein
MPDIVSLESLKALFSWAQTESLPIRITVSLVVALVVAAIAFLCAMYLTSPPPKKNVDIPILGEGGNAEVTGNRSTAIGGPAGESGIVLGGPGGDAKVHGDDSLAIGGQGGGAPQANGRGGRGGVAALGMGYGEILPDGHRMSDFGRGGDGAHSAEYLRTHWVALNIDEMVTLFSSLRTLSPEQVHIVCNGDNCSDLVVRI